MKLPDRKWVSTDLRCTDMVLLTWHATRISKRLPHIDCVFVGGLFGVCSAFIRLIFCHLGLQVQPSLVNLVHYWFAAASFLLLLFYVICRHWGHFIGSTLVSFDNKHTLDFRRVLFTKTSKLLTFKHLFDSTFFIRKQLFHHSLSKCSMTLKMVKFLLKRIKSHNLSLLCCFR